MMTSSVHYGGGAPLGGLLGGPLADHSAACSGGQPGARRGHGPPGGSIAPHRRPISRAGGLACGLNPPLKRLRRGRESAAKATVSADELQRFLERIASRRFFNGVGRQCLADQRIQTFVDEEYGDG